MSRDLDNTIEELGPEYRAVVKRLRAPFSPRPSLGVGRYLVAASAFLVLGLSVWRYNAIDPDSSSDSASAVSAPRVYTVAYASDEFALKAILDSQRNDGSWSNDYVTMQNAAALRRANDELSRIAYKRAVRYLRTKGLDPISDDELARRTSRIFPAG